MKIIVLLLSFITGFLISKSQDLNYTYKIINEISSPKYFGRGYVNYGDSIAAQFLANEYNKIGLQKYYDSYFQEYVISVNRLTQMPQLFFDNNELVPVDDFIVIPSSPEVDKTYKIEWITANTLKNQWAL
jgi:aminopeptidase YwaD